MTLRFIEQDDRVCTACNKRFLSGMIHIERGYVATRLCLQCVDKGGFERAERITRYRNKQRVIENAIKHYAHRT